MEPQKNKEPANTHGYEPPQVVDYGSLTEITAGSVDGAVTDAAFPIGSPKGDITFS